MDLAFTQHSFVFVVPVIILFVDNALLSTDVVYPLMSCVCSASAHAISPFRIYSSVISFTFNGLAVRNSAFSSIEVLGC